MEHGKSRIPKLICAGLLVLISTFGVQMAESDDKEAAGCAEVPRTGYWKFVAAEMQAPGAPPGMGGGEGLIHVASEACSRTFTATLPEGPGGSNTLRFRPLSESDDEADKKAREDFDSKMGKILGPFGGGIDMIDFYSARKPLPWKMDDAINWYLVVHSPSEMSSIIWFCCDDRGAPMHYQLHTWTFETERLAL